MNIDRITWGETYIISVTPKDAEGVAINISSGWEVVCRITRGAIGGAIAAEPVMAISGTSAQCEIDTGAEGWTQGTYYYDVRVTDPEGNDYWTEPVKLILENRNSPPSV